MDAPYRRIVADIRDRIARGELRPGDRVPSTRRIVRDWGVAMATATKVIAALRDEGLVDTHAGAGTVVRPPTPARRSREHDLNRERIVRAAIAVTDLEGLAVLSMRRVATDLGVATMSLYRHVSGKDELTLRMVDAVFAEQPLPRLPTAWRARMELAARSMWTVFRRHPWAAEFMSMTRPQVLPHILPYAECSISTLRGLGFESQELIHIHLSVFGHVRGVALTLQPEEQAQRDTGMTNDEWMETQVGELRRVVATGRFPAFAWLVQQTFDYDLDEVFEYGLQRLLDGVAARLPNR